MFEQLEDKAISKGYRFVVGCDEAGRGPLAGPVVGAAVHLPNGVVIEGLNDSKKITEKKRKIVYDQIVNCEKIQYGVGIVSAEEIDRINILQASLKAMSDAVNEIDDDVDFIFVDGNRVFVTEIAIEAVVKGDGRVASIAAASVIAKVIRDQMMEDLAARHPEYGFEKHKGYPTKDHMAALEKYGPLNDHRKSFAPVKNLYNYCLSR